jgi:hypothetical protein
MLLVLLLGSGGPLTCNVQKCLYNNAATHLLALKVMTGRRPFPRVKNTKQELSISLASL